MLTDPGLLSMILGGSAVPDWLPAILIKVSSETIEQ